jgi:3-oxoacyl-[acyl-carrier protein] reductase
MELGLRNKIVLVTGASKGIGRAVAEAFAAEGSKVAITARGAEELQKTAGEISQNTGAELVGIAADMSKADDITRAVDEVVKRFGTVHVLVNNAGGVGAFAPTGVKSYTIAGRTAVTAFADGQNISSGARVHDVNCSC